jgi:hypothetical protein
MFQVAQFASRDQPQAGINRVASFRAKRHYSSQGYAVVGHGRLLAHGSACVPCRTRHGEFAALGPICLWLAAAAGT